MRASTGDGGDGVGLWERIKVSQDNARLRDQKLSGVDWDAFVAFVFFMGLCLGSAVTGAAVLVAAAARGALDTGALYVGFLATIVPFGLVAVWARAELWRKSRPKPAAAS